MDSYQSLMREAIELAERGRGFVEPNPLVGCLICQDGKVIGRGWHQKFGGPHAEVHALESCQQSPQGATAVVTLEPCCHHGKTPPCADALIAAGIRKVVVGLRDPHPLVDGGGLLKLQQAGIEVESGCLAAEVALQNAGFLKRIRTGKPWVIAKYAMTLDGNLATLAGDSKWISNEKCRGRVHQLRSRVDGIIVGARTVDRDDPLLTARPLDPAAAGPRQPTRIVLNSDASISPDSQLVQTCHEVPSVLVADPRIAAEQRIDVLRELGVEILLVEQGYGDRLETLLTELARREMTNVIVEGGSVLLGEFLEANQIDELQIYLAPKLLGKGRQPFAAPEVSTIANGKPFELLAVEQLDDNLFVRGLVNREVLAFE